MNGALNRVTCGMIFIASGSNAVLRWLQVAEASEPRLRTKDKDGHRRLRAAVGAEQPIYVTAARLEEKTTHFASERG